MLSKNYLKSFTCLSLLMLSQCSGGASSLGDVFDQNIARESNQGSSGGDSGGSSGGGSGGSSGGDSGGSSGDDNSGDSTGGDSGSGSNGDDNSGDSTGGDSGSGSNGDDNSGDSTGGDSGSGSNGDDNSGDTTGGDSGSGSNGDDNSGDSTGGDSGSGSNGDDNSGDSTGDDSGSSSNGDDNSGDDGSNSDTGDTGEQTGTPISLPSAPIIFPSSDFDTSEYNRNPTLDQINAISAYRRGITGEGVIIAIGDSGINEDLSEFEGKLHRRSGNIVDTSKSFEDTINHGTIVASVVGANKDSSDVHGLAYDSELLIFKLTDENDLFDYAAISASIDIAQFAGAKVYNMSFGEGTDPSSKTVMERIIKKAANADIVTVLAAGNDATDNPDYSSQSAEESNGTAIIAGAVDSNNELTDYSAKAGDFADYYLVAPGNVIGVGNDGNFYRAEGTSFAAPHISGAAALLRSQWPQLTASQTVDILFQTAIDLGDLGVDEIYGHGLLDIDRAVQPVGVVTTRSANGRIVQLSPSSYNLSSPLFSVKPVETTIVGIDGFNRDFKVKANLFQSDANNSLLNMYQEEVIVQPSRFVFDNLTFNLNHFSEKNENNFSSIFKNDNNIDKLNTSFNLNFDNTNISYQSGFLGSKLSKNAQRINQLFGSNNIRANNYNKQNYGYNISLSKNILPLTNVYLDLNNNKLPINSDKNVEDVTLKFGFMTGLYNFNLQSEFGYKDEENLLIGTMINNNLLSNFSAKTNYFHLSIDKEKIFNNVDFFANMSFGTTNFDNIDYSLINGLSAIKTNEWTVGFVKNYEKNKVSFAVHQPLLAYDGDISYMIAKSYDYNNNKFNYENMNVDISPNARELSSLFSYVHDNGDYIWKVNYSYRLNAFHKDGENVSEFKITLQKPF